jgi:hypothetical protein
MNGCNLIPEMNLGLGDLMSLYFMMEKIITFPFDFKKLQSWERLEKHVIKSEAYDCVINCLYFLNIVSEPQANVLAKKANMGILSNLLEPYDKDDQIVKGTTIVKGTSPSVIIDSVIANYIKHFLKEHRKKVSIKLDVPNNEMFLEENLKNEKSTILAFRKHNAVGHAVIAFNFENLIHIFDPQEENIILNKETTTQHLSRLLEKMGVSNSARRSNTNFDVETLIEKYNKTNPKVVLYKTPTYIWIYENKFDNYQILFLEDSKKIILNDFHNTELIIRKRKDLSPKTKRRRINSSSKTEKKNSHSSFRESQSDKMDTSYFRVSQSDKMDTS